MRRLEPAWRGIPWFFLGLALGCSAGAASGVESAEGNVGSAEAGASDNGGAPTGPDGGAVDGAAHGGGSIDAGGSDVVIVPGGPKRVMPLGDSITFGQNSVSYRYYLWKKLQQGGFTNADFVGTNPSSDFLPDKWDRDSEGHSGLGAGAIANNITAWASDSRARPDIVLMHVGGVNGGVIEDVGQIIDKLRGVNPHVRILLAQIIPMGGKTWAAFNDQIALLAPQKTTVDSPVVVVDQRVGFDPATDFQVDHTHPNEDGNQVIANNWYGPLIAWLGSPP